jgi:hypothetical protein
MKKYGSVEFHELLTSALDGNGRFPPAEKAYHLVSIA